MDRQDLEARLLARTPTEFLIICEEIAGYSARTAAHEDLRKLMAGDIIRACEGHPEKLQELEDLLARPVIREEDVFPGHVPIYRDGSRMELARWQS